MTSNKSMGSRFEGELCQMLSEHGFWAHNIAQGRAGQPADVIACRDNIPALIDCKVCSTDCFRLSRVEPNQEAAMMLWLKKGNRNCCFALKLSGGEIYMLPFNKITAAKANNLKILSHTQIHTSSLTLAQWLQQWNGGIVK